jgi:hypothetical protein
MNRYFVCIYRLLRETASPQKPPFKLLNRRQLDFFKILSDCYNLVCVGGFSILNQFERQDVAPGNLLQTLLF